MAKGITQKKISDIVARYQDPSLFITVMSICNNGKARYVYANERVLKLFNVAAEDICSMTRRDLYIKRLNLPDSMRIECSVELCVQEMMQTSGIVKKSEVISGYDNESRDIAIAVEPVMTGARITGAIISVQVIGGYTSEQAMVREDEIITHIYQLRSLKTILKINDIVNSENDPDLVYYEVMRKVQEVLITEAGSLLLYSEADRKLNFVVALGADGDKLAKKADLSLDSGIGGWVARNRLPLVVNDPYGDPRFDRRYDDRTGFLTRAIICAPLIHRGELLGVIQAINPVNRHVFSDFDLELMVVFAGIVSNAIAHVLAVEAVSEYKKDSVRILYQMFSEREREYLDCYSQGLSRREIAKAMDVFPETCDAYFRRIKGKLDSMSVCFEQFIDQLKAYRDASGGGVCRKKETCNE